jgi:hypothetical protein
MPVTIKNPATKADKFPNMPASKRRCGHAKVKAPIIPLTMPGRYTTGNILAVTGWSASTLWNRIRDGRFPKPNKDGKRAWWPTHVVKEALGL